MTKRQMKTSAEFSWFVLLELSYVEKSVCRFNCKSRWKRCKCQDLLNLKHDFVTVCVQQCLHVPA